MSPQEHIRSTTGEHIFRPVEKIAYNAMLAEAERLLGLVVG